MVVEQLGLHQQSYTDDPYYEQEEDALSLCDLPLTISSDSNWDEYFSNKDKRNSPFGGDDDDEGFFGFFSEDFTASTLPAAEKIVFCGKIIGSKGGGGEDEEKTIGRESQSQEFMNSNKGSNLLFHKLRTTSARHRVRSSPTHRKTLSSVSPTHRKTLSSVSSSQLVKSKWYVFAFGMGRYSMMEMEQRDIKKRQTRRAPATTMFRTVEKGGLIEGKGKRSGKGLWGLLRLLGCKKNRKTQ